MLHLTHQSDKFVVRKRKIAELEVHLVCRKDVRCHKMGWYMAVGTRPI